MQNMEQHKSEFGDKSKIITIENLTPVLSLMERKKRKKEIEKRLFNVFNKHV